MTVQAGTGELFRIDAASGEISLVDLGGERLGGGGELVTIELGEGLTSGTVVPRP